MARSRTDTNPTPSWVAPGPIPAPITLLALDQALLHSGWCLASPDGWSGGTLSTNPHHSLGERLTRLRDGLLPLIRNAQHVVYEQIHTPRSQVGWEALLRVETLLLVLLHDLERPYLALSPHPKCHLGWRRQLNLGNASKAEVFQFAQQHVPVTNQHEADAFCIAWAALQFLASK